MIEGNLFKIQRFFQEGEVSLKMFYKVGSWNSLNKGFISEL